MSKLTPSNLLKPLANKDDINVEVDMNSLVLFGPYAGMTVADIIDRDVWWMKRLLKTWTYYKVSDLVRDYIQGYMIEVKKKSVTKRVAIRDQKKRESAEIKAEPVAVSETVDGLKKLDSKLLPKTGIVTMETIINFGPFTGISLKSLINKDQKYAQSVIEKWPPSRLDKQIRIYF
ncbi:hypothetical protein [Spirosoma sordidisoli]|uniref:Uncharacterized protein n=1 Tax=Spirosoma sordidisoli TaxID=2502893 RepID=A0A4Q2UP98_9BACT|nr:hypothetical protein [Spirosoma sordidisoli]RYC70702.1 hypothetical protein EQG79_00690 [Spirosoma sordidisoli]